MSKERSPREVCSTTIGTRFISFPPRSPLHQNKHLLRDKLGEPRRASCNTLRVPTGMDQGDARTVGFDLEIHVHGLAAILGPPGMPGKPQMLRRVPSQHRSPLAFFSR